MAASGVVVRAALSYLGAREREANKRAVFGGTIVQQALEQHSPASGACLEWSSVHRFLPSPTGTAGPIDG